MKKDFKFLLKHFICCFFLITILTGCSQIDQILTGQKHISDAVSNDENDSSVVEDEEVTFAEDEKIFTMGEPFYDYFGEATRKGELIKKWPTVEYIVTSARIYNTPKEAGITKKQLIDSQVYMQLSPKNPQMLSRKTIAKSKILLCDITITNIDDKNTNISALTFAYEKSNGKFVEVGFPIYFSASKGKGQYRLDYTLSKGQTMDVQVAWIADAKALDIEELDYDKFYLITNFSGSEKEFTDILKLKIQ